MTDTATGAPLGEAARGLETRSIDFVPLEERHGRIWHLFPVWFAGNANLATAAIGYVGIAAGANLLWTVVAVAAGCGFGTIFSALHSTQGPQLGLPQLIQSRPQFGYTGALLVFLLALLTYAGYNIFCAVLAGESVQVTTGLPTAPFVVIVGVVTGALALFGYDWIHRVARWATLLFTVLFVVLTVVVLAQGVPGSALDLGDFALTPFLVQFGAAAGSQINWAIYVSDYTRYLPPDVDARRMFWCSYIGMTVCAVWLAALGAVLAVLLPASDAVAAVAAVGNQAFPRLGDAAVLIGLIGLLVVMAMNCYGGSLTLISIIDTVRRVDLTARLRAATVAGMTLATTAAALVVSDDFLAGYTLFLQVLLYLFAPWTAVNLVDFFLVRRGHYSVADIFDPAGIYGRFNVRGWAAYGLGALAELPFVATSAFTGPLADALGGVDLAVFVGLGVAGVAYRWLAAGSPVPGDSPAPS